MDLELLRTFLEVNRTRHFGQAAQALHLTQAAVSARIKQIENILGVRLFDRLRRDIRLTPEGHRLVNHADLLIDEWRKARQEVALGGARQQLSVGGTLRLWDVVLQDWFHRLRRQQPQLAIIAESLPAPLVAGHLRSGRLHRVPDAPTIERPVAAIYPLRGAKTELITKCLELFETQ